MQDTGKSLVDAPASVSSFKYLLQAAEICPSSCGCVACGFVSTLLSEHKLKISICHLSRNAAVCFQIQGLRVFCLIQAKL